LYKGVYKDLFMTKISPTSSQLLNRENCLLVVIDVQEKLMPVIAKGVRVINNLVVLLKFARLTGLPVIVTEQQKLGATVAEVYAEASDIQPVFKWEFDCFACEVILYPHKPIGQKQLAYLWCRNPHLHSPDRLTRTAGLQCSGNKRRHIFKVPS